MMNIDTSPLYFEKLWYRSNLPKHMIPIFVLLINIIIKAIKDQRVDYHNFTKHLLQKIQEHPIENIPCSSYVLQIIKNNIYV